MTAMAEKHVFMSDLSKVRDNTSECLFLDGAAGFDPSPDCGIDDNLYVAES